MNDRFYVYMLKCRDGSFYVGHTDDLEKRISEHNLGKYDGYTSTRLPVIPVYTQDFDTREAAKMAEWKLKKWSAKKKEALANRDWKLISLLGKKKFEK